MSAPEKIVIAHDDHYAEHVGRTADGRQFFVTTPFVPALGGDPGREFLAVYLFDGDGALVDARIDDLGTREALDEDEAAALRDRRIEELGPLSFESIEVRPFSAERFGVSFGLIAQPPEEDGEDWSVIVEPGNYMAFYPPWDGDYDT